MSDRSALILGLAVLAALGLDLMVLQTGATRFLLLKLVGLTEYLIFWR